MTVEEALERWRKWMEENPDADTHQIYYAGGVVDGLAFANGSQNFEPTWPSWFKKLESR